jgi:tetratricopeptide (TPR) repeat protein
VKALVLGSIGAALLVAAPAPARADKADALFDKGKQLLAKKKYADACATFEKVDGLDPGIGAKLNVARCYEEWGKLGRAYRWYSDAEKMASETGDKRAPKIKELIQELDPDVPRLTVHVTPGADLVAAAITLDGETLPAASVGRETRVDPGPHEIAYRVNGEKKTKTIALERGGSREVALELPKPGEGAPDGAQDSGAQSPGPSAGKGGPARGSTPGRGRRILAFSLMGAGAIGLGVAGYLAFDARDTYNAAIDAHCMGAKDMCSDEGLRITGDARSQANLATVVAIAGTVAAAGGLVLYLTAPSSGRAESLSRNAEALYIAPVLGPGAGLVVLGGRY